VQNQASQFGQQLSAQNAQNQAQNNLEQARINEAIAARQTGVTESAAERALRLQLQGAEQTFQRGETALERDLRRALQSNELTYQESQFGRNFVQNAERIAIERQAAAAQQRLAENQLFIQLAEALKVLSPAQVQNIIKYNTTPRDTGGGNDGGGNDDNSI
jgi:hypothetical protein